MKTEYPHLIECPTEAPKDKSDDGLPPPPATPDTIDKENVRMTQIIPHIFVGTYHARQRRKPDENRSRKLSYVRSDSRR